jgi:hypothetical protein
LRARRDFVKQSVETGSKPVGFLQQCEAFFSTRFCRRAMRRGAGRGLWAMKFKLFLKADFTGAFRFGVCARANVVAYPQPNGTRAKLQLDETPLMISLRK